MVEHVKRLKRELVYKGAILDIYKDTMELPDGNKAEWDLYPIVWAQPPFFRL